MVNGFATAIAAIDSQPEQMLQGSQGGEAALLHSLLFGSKRILTSPDCFDGSIQGFHVDGHMRAELCVKALEDACRKSGARGMIVHSDRGSQFTSHLFREALKRYRAIQSMSGTGRCYDNARMESFFATLKKEKLYPVNTRTLTKEEVQSILFRYISYYNLRRISLVNGGLPPLVYRQQYLERTGAA